MMQEQPPIDTGKDILILLTGSWVNEETGEERLCPDACLVEGAMLLNPHWADAVTIIRVDYPRPRQPVIDLLDEENQNAPTLILAADTKAHQEVEAEVNGRRIMTDPKTICRQLAASHGGSRPA
ncbi:MAG: DUF3088 family protein [Maricaulis sp.]|uniref:DUF3088 family protein n=1 Tax=Maricaulis sp. TaxID=1486257 RepID=UPI001B13A729|nr:DUF3088 family protein [Maricaulis sp.]MBO6730096.1 DUF3088 family protein [Maricaulis sp.]MBO6847690.1 DUF3088 family protein [Maricaulis sp.]MBO6878491.1 DUF3088 family protein [Maricaulis sp.]